MTRLELQRALYDARAKYAKAQAQVRYQEQEIKFLNQCIKELDSPTNLYDQMFDNIFVS